MSLIEAAFEARSRAYAPYSGYAVGCSVRGVGGQIFTGCNIENASYGATICAERAAIAAMVAAGEQAIDEIVLATRDAATPCGICLQVIAEFAPDPERLRITCVADGGAQRCYTLTELLPHAFGSRSLDGAGGVEGDRI